MSIYEMFQELNTLLRKRERGSFQVLINREGRIRFTFVESKAPPSKFCPLTALAFLKFGIAIRVHRFSRAAALLNLESLETGVVVRAADGRRGGDFEVRNVLLDFLQEFDIISSVPADKTGIEEE